MLGAAKQSGVPAQERLHRLVDDGAGFLAVANDDHFDDRRAGSSIDFWRPTPPLAPNNVQLVKTEHSVPVTRGAHSMVIAR